jgi:tetratricopeptide (TPR) repeat protein
MTFETTELRSAQEYTQIVATSERMVTDGDHFEALLKLIDILETGDDQEPYYSNAQFLVGVVLFHLELYQASYMYFERVLDAETPSERYNDVLPWLVAVHQRIPGEESTLERMAEYDEAVYPEQLKNEIHFFVGQFHYNQGTFRSALEALGKVTEGQEEFYLRARYLEGVVHVRNDNARASADSFKAILRYKVNSGLSSPVSEKIHRMALLTLARIFYTIGQYRTAIRYYDQIPDYSAHWLESLLEVSWSYFHVQNYGRALGNLHTLNSPYFEEEYFPEALVLEAVILYYNCHYDQSLASIHRFIRSYHPLFKELDEQLQVPRDPTQFYGWLARVSRSGSDISMRLKRIFNAALTDRKLNRRFRFVLHLNQELESLTRLSQNAPMTAFAAQLHGEISAVRALSVGEAGTLAKSRLQAVHEELRRQLSDALKVKFEALNAQKRVIEQNASIVDAESREFDHDTLDEEHQYWPFEGEYWKDELDSYTVGIESRCPTQAPAPNDASE